MKIAIYKRIDSGYESPQEVMDWLENSDSYIRLTEPLDVEFANVQPKEMVEKELSALAKAEQHLREQFQMKLDDIIERRQKLLSLPNLAK